MKVTKSIALFFFFVVSFSSRSAWTSEDWQKEFAFKPFGSRWALAYDVDGKMTAIYDLSFPEWSRKFFLGRIGKHRSLKRDVIADVLTAKEDVETNQKDADDALAEMARVNSGPLDDGVIPQPPGDAVITLADLDHDQRFNENKKTMATVERAQSLFADLEGSTPDQNFLAGFQFEKEGDGEFNVNWQKATGPVKQLSGPRKLCDLRSLKWAFAQTAKIYSINITLSELAGISGPTIAGAFAATALDRFFHFYDLMLKTQQNMLLEALVEAGEPDSLYSQFKLNPNDRKLAIEALTFSQSSLEASYKWKWTNPEKEWAKAVVRASENEKSNVSWLERHHMNLQLLNSRFGWTIDSAGKSTLALLASHKVDKKRGPRVAIDYSNLNRIHSQRLLKEMTTSAVVFGTEFIPYAGYIVRYFYKKWIERNYDSDKVWEGRLMIALEELMARLATPFALEVKTLDHQRVNPLVASTVETQNLIEKRRHLLGF